MLTEATALVIRGTDWSETSRIATLFTREHGTIRALAKGGRRLKSSFEIAFDLLTVCEVVFIRKQHGGLDLLTEARLVEKFPALRDNLQSLYSGYYLAELLAEGTADYDPHPALFDAATSTLRQLAETPSLWPFRVMAFELVWLRELGYSPRLDRCAICSTPVPATVTRVQYSPAAGGLVCSSCDAPGDRRWLSKAALTQLQQFEMTKLPKPVELELRSAISQTVCHLLAKRPKLLNYIET